MRKNNCLPDTGFFYHSDHLGSTSYITDSQGNVTQHHEYVPFGETFVSEYKNAGYNSPYRFNSKEFDSNTGFYYYGARYYNPKTSLWISVDPLAEKTMNSYIFCSQNPVFYIDPDGNKEYPNSYKGKLSAGDWRTSDRTNNTKVWQNANKYNTQNQIKNQYEPYSQVLDYYKWVRTESQKLGHEVKWMDGAIGLVGNLTMLENGAFSALINDEAETLLQNLNKGIQNGTMSYFNELLYGKYKNTPLKGASAQAFDTALVNYEQGTVAPPLYASASKESLKYMNQLAHSSGAGYGWHTFIGGGSAPDFSLFSATVTDTQARIDIPLLMLYPSTHKPKWEGFSGKTQLDGRLNKSWADWFKGKNWIKN